MSTRGTTWKTTKSIVFGLFAFFMITLSLFHIFFDPNSIELVNHKKNTKELSVIETVVILDFLMILKMTFKKIALLALPS